MFLLICSIVLIFCAVKYIFRDKQLYAFADTLPGPKAIAVIGSSHKFFKKNEQERFEIMSGILDKYQSHKLVKFWLGTSLFIFVNDPALIKQVLNSPKCLDKSFFYKFFRLDKGLLSLRYDTWELHRKLLEPSFHREVVSEFLTTFNDSTELMRKSLDSAEINSSNVDILRITSKCALTMILSTSFGISTTEVHFSDEIIKAVEELCKIISSRCREPILYIEPVYRVTRSYYREKKYRKRCYAYLDQVLKERRDYIAPQNNNTSSGKAASSSTKHITDEEMGVIHVEHKNFIDHLLLGEEFTDEEIHDHLYTFIAAGYEKVALQSAHTLIMLAMHENKQESLFREIHDMNLTGKLKQSDLDRMTYLDAVIRETMRLLPAVPIIGREVMEEFQLGESTVPKSVTLVINFFKLHRNSDIWSDDANEFRPERFLASDSSSNSSSAKDHFMPFSTGPRSCIAKHFADLALKVMIVDFIRHYKISTDLKYDELKFKSDVTLKTQQKLMVKVERRLESKS